ncbi:MAG: hypothetical protein WBD40_13035 [Tepidisphaeraceae bacterium]
MRRLIPAEPLERAVLDIVRDMLVNAPDWKDRLVNELFPKAVDGGDSLSGDSFSVDEHDAVDQVLQLGAAVQFPPA